MMVRLQGGHGPREQHARAAKTRAKIAILGKRRPSEAQEPRPNKKVSQDPS
jgi:hypothetical protein